MGVDTQKRTLRGGALERGHGAALEPLTQLGDALGGVGAAASKIAASIIEAAELVAGQTAVWQGVVSRGADTKANALGRRRTPVVGSASP